MTPRRVTITLEVESDIPKTELERRDGYWFDGTNGRLFSVEQVQVNVMQGVQRRARSKPKRTRRG